MSLIKSSKPDLVSTLVEDCASFAAQSTTHKPVSELLSDNLPCIHNENVIHGKHVRFWIFFHLQKNATNIIS